MTTSRKKFKKPKGSGMAVVYFLMTAIIIFLFLYYYEVFTDINAIYIGMNLSFASVIIGAPIYIKTNNKRKVLKNEA